MRIRKPNACLNGPCGRPVPLGQSQPPLPPQCPTPHVTHLYPTRIRKPNLGLFLLLFDMNCKPSPLSPLEPTETTVKKRATVLILVQEPAGEIGQGGTRSRVGGKRGSAPLPQPASLPPRLPAAAPFIQHRYRHRMRSSLVVRASDCQCTSCTTVLDSIPASVGTAESEGWQMEQCWI